MESKIEIFSGILKECSNENHKSYGSIYPKNSVPIEFFVSKNHREPLKTCIDCRNYSKKSYKKYNAKLINASSDSMMSDCQLKFCPDRCHNTHGSPYPIDKVPAILFLKDPDNPKSPHVKCCKDCRDYIKPSAKEKYKFNKSNVSDNMFYCPGCKTQKSLNKVALNKDDSKSVSCVDCKPKEKERSILLKTIYKNIIYEYIKKYESCCNLCNNIYIKNITNNAAMELETYLIDNIRKVKFNHVEFHTKNFLLEFKDHLEIDILQFDHLTEKEQRQEGILSDNENYIKKRDSVSKMKSEKMMRSEASKCQLLCARCHIKTTISREKGRKILIKLF
jgi:hypothetical protein